MSLPRAVGSRGGAPDCGGPGSPQGQSSSHRRPWTLLPVCTCCTEGLHQTCSGPATIYTLTIIYILNKDQSGI